MEYAGNFRSNNSVSYLHDILCKNKFKLNNHLRDVAKSERFEGNDAHWVVEDENFKTIFHGNIEPNGRIWYDVYNGITRFY